jgi:hypothetical protein
MWKGMEGLNLNKGSALIAMNGCPEFKVHEVTVTTRPPPAPPYRTTDAE